MVSLNQMASLDTDRLNLIAKETLDEYILSKQTSLAAQVTVKSSHSPEDITGSLAATLEHSMITQPASPAMVDQFCREALLHEFAAVCVPAYFVRQAADLVKGSRVKVGSALAFPFGNTMTAVKVAETLEIIRQGGLEIDMPLNIGLVKSGAISQLAEDIKAVLAAAAGQAVIKVVVDLGLLSLEEQVKVALLAKQLGAPFLKIAAGSRPQGVSEKDIQLFRYLAGPDMGLKADGGIKDYKDAIEVINAGADRIGASRSVKIVSKT